MRYTVATIGLIVCLLGAKVTLQEGYATFLSKKVSQADGPVLLEKAIRLSSLDPDLYQVKASAHAAAGNVGEAVNDLRTAIALRPRDYYLWFELGLNLYQTGDQQGALRAFQQSTLLAPYYGQPRWYLGYVLLYSGEREAAFAELRRAATSSPGYFPELIKLAADSYKGDAQRIQEAIQPRSVAERLALARYFIAQGNPRAALDLIRGAELASEQRNALVQDLLSVREFTTAYEFWKVGRAPEESETQGEVGIIHNGGFEDAVISDGSGFAWGLIRNSLVLHSELDTTSAYQGKGCVRFDFNGNSSPDTMLLSQLVIVKPTSRYKLSFAAKSFNLVSGGLPEVVIYDASKPEKRQLAPPLVLAADDKNWKNHSIEFITSTDTVAMLVVVERERCSRSPCPVFGRLFLDDFHLLRL